MNFPLLLEAVKLTRERGMTQFVETNAAWCTSEDRARDWLGQLSEGGLDSILISCSPFQSERIPLNRVIMAIETAGDLLGHGKVGVYQTQFIQEMSKFAVDETFPIKDYIKRYGEERAGQIFWDIYALIDSGRASYTLGHLTQRHQAKSFQRQNCQRELLYAHH